MASPPEASHLITLGRITALGLHSEDAAAVLPRLLGELIGHFNASSGSIALLNPDTGRLEIEAQSGLPDDYREVALRLGQGVTGWVAFHARPQLVFVQHVFTHN